MSPPGYLERCVAPWAFKSYAHILNYNFSGTGSLLFSLDGVSTMLAVGVFLNEPRNPTVQLYMAPSRASYYQHYVINIGIFPPANGGPIISANDAHSLGASYVCILGKPAVQGFGASSMTSLSGVKPIYTNNPGNVSSTGPITFNTETNRGT